MNILVTGGAGYIGSHICKRLAANGYAPITYDNLSRGCRRAVKWGPLEVGELEDRDRLRQVFREYEPTAVMHFAAYAYVGESVDHPLLYYRNNVAGTIALLDEIFRYRTIPVIFSSSCVTYGIPDRLPITEEHPQRPINPYGYSKFFVEQILSDVEKAHGLQWVALRYFNAAGADPEGDIGEDHVPETHLIPLVLQAARDKQSVAVFGTDYDTSDGTCVRDYVHVMDIADAHLLALRYLQNGGSSRAFNLANTRGYSVKEVVATAEAVCGRSIAINAAPRRAGDPPILIGSSKNAQDILGWQPKRSDLNLQITDAWNWIVRQTTLV